MGGGWKFGLAVKQPAQIQKPRLTSLQRNTFRNFATYMVFIIWVTNKSTNFLQVFPRKIENLISGDDPNKSGGWEIFQIFQKNKRGM